jgi:hypothetical protein
MPEARIKSKLPIEIVVENGERHHTSVRKPRTHAYRRASISSTNVGAGCSCHPTSANHHRSARVPFHPVWQMPVARFPVRNLTYSDSRLDLPANRSSIEIRRLRQG